MGISIVINCTWNIPNAFETTPSVSSHPPPPPAREEKEKEKEKEKEMEMEKESEKKEEKEGDETIPNIWRYTSDGEFSFPSESMAPSSMNSTLICSFELIDYGALYPVQFSVQRLSASTGKPISRKQTLSFSVPYPKDDIKYPWRHYVVFNSNQNGDCPILVDRLVVKRDIPLPIRNRHVLEMKKFRKKF